MYKHFYSFYAFFWDVGTQGWVALASLGSPVKYLSSKLKGISAVCECVWLCSVSKLNEAWWLCVLFLWKYACLSSSVSTQKWRKRLTMNCFQFSVCGDSQHWKTFTMNASGGKKQRENYLLCVWKKTSCLVLAKEQSACQHDLGLLLDRVCGKEKATYTLC